MSKVSSIESNILFNNISRQLFNEKQPTHNLQINKLTHQNFFNLNFFENSRLWVFKKYFFSNNQGINLIINTPLLNKTNLPSLNTLPNNNQPSSIGFYTSNTLNKLGYLVNNSYTPSLYNKITIGDSLGSPNQSTKLLNLHTFVNTNSTDLLNGNSLNFLFTITSNPKNLNGLNTNYFSWLVMGNKPNFYNPNTLYTNIKFYK
jgi:hypothetical protein